MNAERSHYKQYIHTQLKSNFPEDRQREGLIRALLEDSPVPLDQDTYPVWLAEAIQLIQAGKPIQYITGIAHFYGHSFSVTPATLIPRSETEELTDLAIRWLKANPDRRSVLEVGTGSGCIAISIALACPDRQIVAWDHTDGPLEVATENASRLGAKLQLQRRDALDALTWQEIDRVDLLISNPPYIAEDERIHMGADVLAYEPHDALFAPGSDPLIFYRILADQGRSILHDGGRVMVECSAFTAAEAGCIFEDAGYQEVCIHQDMQGLDRMVTATRGV